LGEKKRLKVTISKRKKDALKVPLIKGDLGGSNPAPLFKGGEKKRLKVTISKRKKDALKVPLIKGDLGGSNQGSLLEIERRTQWIFALKFR
jgi:hypothetical protein